MNYKYPKNHPCYNCPYTFPSQKPSCTMGGNPETCVWKSYQKMCGVNKVIIKPQPIHYSQAYEKIQNSIELLIIVGEKKFGKAYADKLRRNRNEA